MNVTTSKSSSLPVKVGFVGVGQRIQEIYLPILKQLSHRYEIVGFTTRSSESLEKFKENTGLSAFDNASDLVRLGKPDFLIVAVADNATEKTLMNLLDLKVPLLTETPLAWSISSGRKILLQAKINNVLLAVAEQTPFLPMEQFKKILNDQGVLGQIYAVYNDFNAYSYHSIAQLRRYLKGSPTHVRSHVYHFGTDCNIQFRNKFVDIEWQFGSVSFDDQSTLFHHYGNHYVLSDICFPQVTRLYGKVGVMVGNEIKLFNQNSSQLEVVVVKQQENEKHILESISASLPNIGTLTWENPYAEYFFSDQEIAVATVLDGMAKAVLEEGQPLYTGEEFLNDIEIVQAFRYSELRSGATIRLPLNEKLQKILMVTNPFYWKSKLSRSKS